MDKQACSDFKVPDIDRNLKGAEKELVEQMIASILRPDAIIEQVIDGPKFIAVIAGGRMGLSAMLGAKPAPEEQNLVKEVIGKSAQEAAGLLREKFAFSISLGLAAMNAGNTPDPDSVNPANFPADELIASLGKDKTVGLVGDFPFVKSLGKKVGTLHLFELQNIYGAVPKDQWKITLDTLDVLAITATSLLTRHMAWYLDSAPKAKIIILGPTTPSSVVFFKNRVNYLCGSVVTDIKKVGDSIASGVCFSEIKKNGGLIFTQWEEKDLVDN